MGKGIEFDLPQPFEVDLGLDSTINVNMDIDPYEADIDLGLDNINVNMAPFEGKIDMGLDDIKVDMGLDNVNVCMSFAVKELPSMRVHLPMNYEFGLEIFGIKVFNYCMGGKSMIISEDNPPRLFYHPHSKGDHSPNDVPSPIRVSIGD